MEHPHPNQKRVFWGRIPSAPYQGLANDGPWVNSGPLSVFVNEVLLGCSHLLIFVLSMAAFWAVIAE